jgi:PAS domain S-box-containing protein
MTTINAAGKVTDVNLATEKITGRSRERLIGSDFANYFTEPEMARAGFLKVFAQGQIIDYPLAVRHKSGAITEVLYNASVYRDEQGKVLGIFTAARDITKRKQAEDLVLRALKEKEVMLKEIHHRVKNNMQVVYSLLNLQAKGISDSAVRTMFEESRNRVSSMALIHEKLYRSNDLAFIDFKEYLKSLMAGIADTYNRRDIILVVEMEPLALDINSGIPCGLIVNELISNSLKHAFPGGRKGTITLGIKKDSAGMNVLTVADNGIGFPAELDFKNTSSLGMQLVTVLTGQLNGRAELSRDNGTKFTITFPDSRKQ